MEEIFRGNSWKLKYSIFSTTAQKNKIVKLVDKDICVEVVRDHEVSRYYFGNEFEIKKGDEINVFFVGDSAEEKTAKFEKSLISGNKDAVIKEIFKKINMNPKVDKLLAYQIIFSKNYFRDKYFFPEVEKVPEIVLELLEMRKNILKTFSGSTKIIINERLRHPFMDFPGLTFKEKRILIGVYQYRNNLHYSEFNKLVQILNYKIVVEDLIKFSQKMNDAGLLML